MENQHRQITGYRELSGEEIDLMNAIKAQGEELEALVESISLVQTIDRRWVSIATTHFQQGLMALTRAVAQPTSF